MSSLSYLLTTSHPEPDFDSPAGQYCVPVGWILGFGPEAKITGPARIEGSLAAARERWRRALASPDPYLRGILGPLQILLDQVEDGPEAAVAIDASELLGVNPQNDDFIRQLQSVSGEALAAIESGSRAAAVAALNRWFATGSAQFSGSGAEDRQWAMSADYLYGGSAEARWASLIIGEADRRNWLEAASAVRFID